MMTTLVLCAYFVPALLLGIAELLSFRKRTLRARREINDLLAIDRANERALIAIRARLAKLDAQLPALQAWAQKVKR